MINIGKKEVIYGYIDVIVAQLANIIVLPIVLHQVNTEEYALWNVFVSIQSFIMLFDVGFSYLIARFATYAMSGAENIPKTGKPIILNDTINYNLLYSILVVSKKIYIKIATLACAILFFLMGYIYYLAKNLSNGFEISFAWIIFSIGIAFSLYFTYYTSFLKGVGKIKEIRIINISANLIQAILKIVLILFGLGLLGISISVTVVLIYRRLLIRKEVFKVFENQEKECFRINEEIILQVNDSLKSNAKQLGTVVIAQYIENQGTTLICSAFLPLAFIGKYGLTLQILSVISSVVSIPTSTFQPVLNQAVAQEDNKRARYYYSLLTVVISLTYWLGIIAVYLLVPTLLVIVKSKTEILGGIFLGLMSFYQFEVIIHQRATKLISYANDQSYTKSYVITAFLEVLCAIFALKTCNGFFLLYLSMLVIVELYNFIVWPMKACHSIGFNVALSYLHGTKICINYFLYILHLKKLYTE